MGEKPEGYIAREAFRHAVAAITEMVAETEHGDRVFITPSSAQDIVAAIAEYVRTTLHKD